jgi:hypothetical protein
MTLDPGDRTPMSASATRSAADAEKGPFVGYFVHQRNKENYWAALSVLNLEGDPEDFFYTEPVTVNRFMQQLLGPRLDAYVMGRVLLEPLVAQVKQPLSLVLFDDPSILQRRLPLTVPAAVLAGPDSSHRDSVWVPEALDGGAPPLSFWVTPQSRKAATDLLRQLAAAMTPFPPDQPFRQMRAAMAELTPPS